MTMKTILLAGAAALALTACGGKDGSEAPKSAASEAAAKVSSASPLDKKFTLKNAEEVDVDALLALASDDARPTYESAEFDSAIGATVVNNLRFADANDGEAIIIERAEFYGVDEAAIERVKNADDAGPDAPFETLFEKVRLLNIKTEGFADEEEGEVNFTIGGVEFDKLAMRQGGPEGNPDGEDGANFLNAVNLGGLYFKDMAFSADTTDVQKVSLSAPDLRVVGMAGGKVDAIIAKDLSYDFAQGPEAKKLMREAMGPQGAILLDGPLGGLIAPESQKATVESFEWRGLDFSGAVEYGVKGEEPPATEKDLMDLGTMKIAGMTSYIEDRPVAEIGEFTVPVMKFAWLIPSDFRFDMKDAVIDYTAYVGDEESPAYAVLKENGLDSVKSEGFGEWKWNPDKGDGKLTYVANSPGLADMSVGFEMTGATLKELAELQEEGNEDAFGKNAALKSFSLKLDDEKALDAIFDLAALQMGGTGDDLRQSAPALIRLSGAQFAQMNPRIQDYVNAFADFVSKGGAIEIKAAPEEPLGAGTLSDGTISPQTLPDALNLTVTHTE